ncbi:MAG TPA: DNA-processing protein DprA, partial [Acidimicrobiia bacterium]|nr:DNA-processing protein DprA [Acidimicrobiia bacterium]
MSGVELIERGRSGYPPALEEIPDAPERLYVRGRLPERPCVAVVGSRSATRYGLG